MARQGQVFVYRDPLNDEFSGIARPPYRVPADYVYIHGRLYETLAAPLYWLVRLFGLCYLKAVYGLRLANRKILKPYRYQGYFLYGNHTHIPADGFIPALLVRPQKAQVVVAAANLALKGTRTLMGMLGAMPLPDTLAGLRRFEAGLAQRMAQKRAVAIYPEAHIWPYYTKIRPFGNAAFAYPARLRVPCFAFTVVYRKRKGRSKPRMEVYLDGPFGPLDPKASLSVQRADLCRQVHAAMAQRSKLSDCEYCVYRKEGTANGKSRLD